MNKQGKIIFSLLSLCTKDALIRFEVNDIMDFMEKYEKIHFGYGIGSGKNYSNIAIQKAVNDVLREKGTDKPISGLLFAIIAGKEISLNDVTDISETISDTLNISSVDTISFGLCVDERFESKLEVVIVVGVD